MNGLTDRLQMIADEIKQGETMADIGTDHGFLPLYLWENGISPSVIMCDISEPSLAIVIAGMGGLLIHDILAADMEKTCSFSKYIFQPRNHAAHLRYWLVSNGFSIVKNQLVREGKFICEVITVLPPKSSKNGDTDLSDTLPAQDDPCWDLPKDMLLSQPELARDYAAVKLGIEQKILEGMRRSSNVSDCELHNVERRIDYFRSYGYEV